MVQTLTTERYHCSALKYRCSYKTVTVDLYLATMNWEVLVLIKPGLIVTITSILCEVYVQEGRVKG